MSALALFRQALAHPWNRSMLRALAAMLVLDAAVAALWFAPAWRRADAAQRAQAGLHDAPLLFERRRSLLERVREAQEKSADMKKRLASAIPQADLARKVIALAQKQGLKLQSATYHEDAGQGGMQIWQQDLALEGSYPALRAFLRELPALGALNAVSEAHLTRMPSGLKAALKVTTWRLASSGAHP
jgi:hypothetical protein